MKNILEIYIISLLISTSIASTIDNKKLFSENLKNSKNFKCNLPQPRSFISRHLFTDMESAASKTILPNSVVLHRCDTQSGCCFRPNHVCGENKNETKEVLLTFQVFNNVYKTTSYESLLVLNHTQCICSLSPSEVQRLPVIVRQISLAARNGLTNCDTRLISMFSLYFVVSNLLFTQLY